MLERAAQETANRHTRMLLWCGVLSSLHYAAINVYVPTLWPWYDQLEHTVSELSAIDAPTRPLWVVLVTPYVLLFAAFGWGILRAGAGSRPLRIAGYVVLLYSAFNLYWPPMHQRAVLAAGGGTLTDTLHLVWAGVTVSLFLVIMALGAAALGWRFRLYTVASAVLLTTFGALTSQGAENVGKDLPTPWIGLWERLNIGLFLVWVIVLALTLLRRLSRSPLISLDTQFSRPSRLY